VADLLAGEPGTIVELAVSTRGGPPRKAVVTRQVLGKQPALKAHGGIATAKPKAGSVHEPAPRTDAGAGKGKGSAKEDSSGATERSSAALGRPVSASSDASFVHVEGSWDDCFAALAQVTKNIFENC
jgi:hypothetical protein